MFRTRSSLPLIVFWGAVSRSWSGKIFGTQLRTDAARTAVHRVMVAQRIVPPIEAGTSEMSTAMSSPVSQVVAGWTEIEIIPVGIYLVNTEVAYVVHRIDGTEEIFDAHKADVLRIRQYPAKVIVAFVQVTVIGIQGAAVSNGDTGKVRIDIVQEIVVDFVQVVVLVGTQMQFEGHAVGQEACIDSEISETGSVTGQGGQAEGQ